MAEWRGDEAGSGRRRAGAGRVPAAGGLGVLRVLAAAPGPLGPCLLRNDGLESAADRAHRNPHPRAITAELEPAHGRNDGVRPATVVRSAERPHLAEGATLAPGPGVVPPGGWRRARCGCSGG